MERKGPKSIATPGEDAASPAASVATADQAKTADAAVIVTKDLTKQPKGERPQIQLKQPKIEAETEEAALTMANELGRAVMSPKGWVCPSVTHERRAAA